MRSILFQEALNQIVGSHPPDTLPIIRSTLNTWVSVTGQDLNSLGSAVVQVSFAISNIMYDCDFQM